MNFENNVIYGAWTDYTNGVYQIVVNETLGYALPAIVGVWLSFSTKYVKRILVSCAIWIRLHWRQRQVSEAIDTEAEPLNPVSQGHSEDVLIKVMKQSGGGVRDLVSATFQNKYKLDWGSRICLAVLATVVMICSVGMIIGGVFTARVKINGAALLDSNHCGLWLFDSENAGTDAATRAGVLNLEKETRAGEYAQNCYGMPTTFDYMRCDFFYRRNISFSTNYSYECPFHSDICAQGQQSVTFQTEVVAASEIGVNSKNPHRFRRTMTCTPLSMEYPFIRNETRDGLTTYYYHYGQRIRKGTNPPKSLPYTHNTTGDPFDMLAPVYDSYVYTTGLNRKDAYWTPIEELSFPDHSTLTIMFISSLRILYLKQSADPLFPADSPIFLESNREPWFYNSDPKARPVACVDQTELYSPSGELQWRITEDPPEDASTPPEYWLTLLSLLSSNMYDSIAKRLGSALLAQHKVSQYQSDALSDDHWVKEMENLFATSLSRAQIDAWSIASGEDYAHVGKDGYTSWTPDEAGNLCGLFKYRPSAYAHIRVWPFVGILCVLPVLFCLSAKWSTVKFWEKSSPSVDASLSAHRYAGGQAGALQDNNSTGPIAQGQMNSFPLGNSHNGSQSSVPLAQSVLPYQTTNERSATGTSSAIAEPEWEPLMFHKVIYYIPFGLLVLLAEAIMKGVDWANMKYGEFQVRRLSRA